MTSEILDGLHHDEAHLAVDFREADPTLDGLLGREIVHHVHILVVFVVPWPLASPPVAFVFVVVLTFALLPSQGGPTRRPAPSGFGRIAAIARLWSSTGAPTFRLFSSGSSGRSRLSLVFIIKCIIIIYQ